LALETEDLTSKAQVERSQRRNPDLENKPEYIRRPVQSLEGHLMYRGRQRIGNDSAAFQTAHHSGFIVVLS